MKPLPRYLLREHLKVLFLALGGFVLILLAVEALERTEVVLSYGAPLRLLGLFLLYRIPAYLVQSLPFALLMSTMVTLGIMGRNKEILAMKVHGVGNYTILAPFLLTSVAVAMVVFVGLEGAVPRLLQEADELWSVRIKGEKKRAFFRAEKVWYLGDGLIYNIRLVEGDELRGMTILYLNKAMGLRKRIDAKRAHYLKGHWTLYDVTIRTFSPTGVKEERVPKLRLYLKETPQDFQRGMKDPEEMSYTELRRYVRKLQREGYDPTRYVVNLHAKVAFPFTSVILVLVGVPLALWTSRRREGGIPLGIALSVIVGMLYWVAFAVSVAAGQGGLLPPWLSAWVANLFFAAVGLYLLEALPY